MNILDSNVKTIVIFADKSEFDDRRGGSSEHSGPSGAEAVLRRVVEDSHGDLREVCRGGSL